MKPHISNSYSDGSHAGCYVVAYSSTSTLAIRKSFSLSVLIAWCLSIFALATPVNAQFNTSRNNNGFGSNANSLQSRPTDPRIMPVPTAQASGFQPLRNPTNTSGTQSINAWPNSAMPPNGASTVNAGGPTARVASLDPRNDSTGDLTNPSQADNDAKGTTIPMRSLLQMFYEGGLLMYPIAICSFVMTVFCFERLLYLRPGRVIPRPFVRRLIEQLEQQHMDREEALELCEKNPSPMATICAAALKRYGRPAVEVEQVVLDAGERVTNQLRKHLRLFNAISNVTPLFGLLGTVLGMIEAFNAISGSNAMGRPELLAGGIGQALLTTAAGLLVAIPSYIAYMFFLGKTDRLVMEMDSYAQQVIDVICSEGLAEMDSTRSRSRSRKAA